MRLAKEAQLPDLSGISIEKLLRRAREGDEQARAELFRRVAQKLEEWSHLPKHRTEAAGHRPSDIAQEVALRAHNGFKAFRGSTEAELYAWINQILVNQVAQIRRDAGRQKRDALEVVSLDAPEPQEVQAQQRSPSQAVAGVEEWRQLVTHIAQLVPPQRDAVSLYYIEGLPIAEVAGQIGKTREAVNSLLQRGLVTLRSRMAQEPEPGDSSGRDTEKALLEYQERHDRGEDIDQEAFVERHPECASNLRALFRLIEQLQTLRPKKRS